VDNSPVDEQTIEHFEVLTELENYQQKIEDQWESAKSSYQNKINQILDEFLTQNGQQPIIETSFKEKINLPPRQDVWQHPRRSNGRMSYSAALSHFLVTCHLSCVPAVLSILSKNKGVCIK
jgi:hypothetical protein